MAVGAAARRDLGFLEWEDTRAWMETMKGPRYRALVREENERFDQAVVAASSPYNPEDLLRATLAQFEAARYEAELANQWELRSGSHYFQLRRQPGGSVLWSLNGGEPMISGDIDVEGDIIAYTTDIGKGAQIYQLIIRDLATGHKWSYKHRGGGVAATIAIYEGRVYCLEGDTALQYTRLVSFDLKRGVSSRRVEYEEAIAETVISIYRGANGCLFFIGDVAGRQELYEILGGDRGLKKLTRRGETAVFPVGHWLTAEAALDPCYFVRSRGRRGRWIARGPAGFRSFVKRTLPEELNTSEEYGIEAVVLAGGGGIIVTREHGERTIWFEGEPVHKWFGDFEAHPWISWRGGVERIPFAVHGPGVKPERGTAGKSGVRLERGTHYAANVLNGFAKCPVDGAEVRWVVCWSGSAATKPKGLISCVYGAYGLPTMMSTGRWKPYLQAGFAVGFACVRGGGDHTESWSSAGQVEGKLLGIADFEACLAAMQEATGIGPKKTVAYGRSAGGYIVGAAAAKAKRNFQTVYTEVPYVDVLRTASNPGLPLTVYEYEEFGNPAASIANAELLVRISPIDAAITAVAARKAAFDDLFVVCRTAQNDTQVYAYESLKWVDVLRGNRNAEEKLLHVDQGSGHFMIGGLASFQRAEDFILICKKMLKRK